MKEQTYRMKEACARTGLTERTIRFYIEKGLLNPQQEEMNGRVLTFFGEEDLARLEEVSLLRKAGFSIDSIATMTKYPQTVDDILREQLAAAEKNAQDSQAVLEHLRNAAGQHYSNVHQLYDALNCEPIHTLSLNTAVSEPNYARFETATKEERLEGYVDYMIARRKQDKADTIRQSILHTSLVLLCVVVVLGTFIATSFAPHHIDQTLECYQYHGADKTVDCMVEVTIQGDFYSPGFVAPYFIGEITIEQLGDDISMLAQFPEEWGQPLRITDKLVFSNADYYSEPIYCFDSAGNRHRLGIFFLRNRDFTNFELWLYMPLCDQNGRYISENGSIIDTNQRTTANRIFDQGLH